MAIVIPNVGKQALLRRALYETASDIDWSLRLYKTNVTPGNATVLGDFTEADFTGYSAKTLTSSQSGSTWTVPAITSNIAYATYQAQMWTAASDQDIYGWYIVDENDVVIAAEKFSSPYSLLGAGSDTLTLTPKLQLDTL